MNSFYYLHIRSQSLWSFRYLRMASTYCENNVLSVENLSKATLFNQNYRYIDSGDRFRLEKFGPYFIRRSCKSAVWSPNREISEWLRDDLITYMGDSGHKGIWLGQDKISLKTNWTVSFDDMLFHLFLSDMGQVGVFPEQESNWNWISSMCQEYVASLSLSSQFPFQLSSNETAADQQVKMRVLNGFAYTGGSTLAALRVPGVEVVHVDSAKSPVKIAAKNSFASG
jgi:23S rRNA (cytosine1962-C5)-methyltransferase